MNLPDSLVVGPFDVAIEDLGSVKVRANYGEYSPSQKTIYLCSDMTDQQTADTLLHEALHAIYDVYSLHGADEEQMVTRLAPAMLALFRFNPALKEILFRG